MYAICYPCHDATCTDDVLLFASWKSSLVVAGLLQNKAEFIDRCFDTLTESALEPAADRGPYTEFTEKMMAILKSA